jgi:GH25 family lysozyme M1 (1,4-beta-N-acetylmuramidase)
VDSGLLQEVQTDTGKTPIIYTEADWWDTCTGDSTAFHNYPLWIASLLSVVSVVEVSVEGSSYVLHGHDLVLAVHHRAVLP